MNKIVKNFNTFYNNFYDFFIPYPLKAYNNYNTENKTKTRLVIILLLITFLFIIVYFFYSKPPNIYKEVDKIQVLPKYTSFNQFSEFSTFNSYNQLNKF